MSLDQGLIAFEQENYSQAFSLLEPIAQQGNAEAQCHIGCLYQLGLGVERSDAKAVCWYRRAAEQQHGLTCNNLAGLLLTGYDGIPPNQQEAEWWYQKAREHGFLHAPTSADYLNRSRLLD